MPPYAQPIATKVALGTVATLLLAVTAKHRLHSYAESSCWLRLRPGAEALNTSVRHIAFCFWHAPQALP